MINFTTPPLYAIDGRRVEIPELEGEYLSGDPLPSSPDLRLVYLFLEATKLREIVRLAAEMRLAQKTGNITRKEVVESEIDRMLSAVLFREPAQASLFGGPNGR